MSRDINKDLMKSLDLLDKMNPYSTYLDESTLSNVNDWIDTGSLGLNGIISGNLHGGIPSGRLTVFAGESMTGKSFIGQKILANAQAAGKIPIIFDTENAIDPAGARALGLDVSKVKYVPSFNIEDTRNQIYNFLTAVRESGQTGKFIILIDSLGNLQSAMEEKRMTKDSDSADMGSSARAMKSLIKTCTQLSALTDTTILATNHVYDDPSAMFPSLTKHMPGGKSVIFLPSVTVQLARKPIKSKDAEKMLVDSTLSGGQRNSGVILRALTVKNRFVKQYLETEMYLSFAKGLDRYYGLRDLATSLNVITPTGATYEMGGEKIGFYKNFSKDIDLWENSIIPAINEKIKVEWTYGSGANAEVPPEEDDDDYE